MKTWEVYHRDREYAKLLGDPCLGFVRAETEQEAATKACTDFPTPTGIWIVETKEP